MVHHDSPDATHDRLTDDGAAESADLVYRQLRRDLFIVEEAGLANA
ncbi:hypothetical protein ACFV2H_35255 [Streptomyces sp. NPDC059629]